MARYPKAVWRPLPENSTQPRIQPRAFFVHSAAVDSANVRGYFAQDKVRLESHFFVLKNGTVEQFMDTEVRADAQGQANPWAISAETEDDGAPDAQPWTPPQLAALIALIGWACDTHGIPRRRLREWSDSGIGWHAQFGAPSPLTTVRGKTCPGRVRIRQFLDIVMPAVTANVTVTPPTPEDDMFSDVDHDRLARIEGLLNRVHYETATGDGNLAKVVGYARTAATRQQANNIDVEALAAALRADLGPAVAKDLASALVERLKD